MNLQTIRENIIKDFVTRELLDDNITPTLELVCSIVLRDYKNVAVFKSMLNDKMLLNKLDPASRSKFNSTSKLAEIDIRTLYAFVDYLVKEIERQKNIIRRRLYLLSKTIAELSVKAEGIAMLNEYSNGYFDIYTEALKNYNNINTEESTVVIDSSGAVIKSTKQPQSGMIQSIEVNCLTPKHYSSYTLTGNPVSQLYDELEDTSWIHEVQMPSDHVGYVEVSMKINLSTNYDFNKIAMDLGQANGNISAKVIARLDNQWQDVTDYQTFSNKIEFSFDEISTNSIVLKIRNNQYTAKNERLIYTFIVKELKILNEQFTGSATLELNPVSFRKPFSAISMNILSEIPDKCSIDVYAKVLTNVWSEFVKIDSPEYFTVSLADSLRKELMAVDLTYSHPYNSNYNICYSYNYPLEKEFNFLTTRLIRGLNEFSKSGSVSKCYFHNTEEKIVDFSNYPGYLDNQLCNSVKNISPGIHSFYFDDQLSENSYKAHLLSNAIIFGSHLAKYVTPSDFINIAEENNLEVFTILKVKDQLGADVYTLMAKIIDEYEVAELTAYEKPSAKASRIVVKFALHGVDGKSPKINNIKIKAA